jgi:hypothetical protein
VGEIRTVTTLRSKREEIAATIAAYERKLGQAQADLAHITAAIKIFKASGDPADMSRYVDVRRIFRRNEISEVCKAAIAQEGPLDTRELAVRVMRAKGLDVADAVLRSSICLRIVQALSTQTHRGTMRIGEKRKGVRVWELPALSRWSCRSGLSGARRAPFFSERSTISTTRSRSLSLNSTLGSAWTRHCRLLCVALDRGSTKSPGPSETPTRTVPPRRYEGEPLSSLNRSSARISSARPRRTASVQCEPAHSGSYTRSTCFERRRGV